MNQIKIHCLASGSTGNAYMIQGVSENLFLEPGIKFDKIRKTLRKELQKVVGVLVSHEHKDHCLSVNDFAKYGFDIYTSEGTLDSMKHLTVRHRTHILDALVEKEIGEEWSVLPFETEHDCAEPLGFLIHNKLTDERIVFITDSYFVSYKFENVDYFMIESNYCLVDIEEELDTIVHSNRLLESHMSLENCIKTLQANDLSKTKRIYLLHLSSRHSDSTKFKKEVVGRFGIPVTVAGID